MSNDKTICTVCDYIYDETLGDTKYNLPPAVPFPSLQESWCCPVCGASKEMFQPCACVQFSASAKSDERNMMTVGQLVAVKPSYARIFESYGIDYCCGGKRELAAVCQEKEINMSMLLQQLDESEEQGSPSIEPDWTKTSLKELIDHITTRYHLPLCKELARIEKMVIKVAAMHGDRHPEMNEVASIFSNFKSELELHMQKEEIILFPSIVRSESGNGAAVFGCGGGIENPIKVMLEEHDSAGDALKAMRHLTANYTAPADACNTFHVLLDALKNLENEMHQHVHKENHILFPRALALAPRVNSCL